MITGAVLARNEASNIVDCLRALRPHVEEVLLIDMESTDSTVELAQPLVDGVLTHPLIPNFDSARNIAIERSRNDWLWFIDADERVPKATGELVNQLVRERGNEFTAITIPFKTYFAGRWIQHSGWWPGYTMPRVLRRGKFSFVDRLHGGVHFDGPELRIAPLEDLAIEHFSYRDISHYVDKFNRYTSAEALNLATDGSMYTWQAAIRSMVRDLWLYYERNSGVKDRAHGWILAWLAGQYRWFSHAKLLDRLPKEQAAQLDCPASLDEVLEVLQEELASCRQSPGKKPSIHFRSPLLDPSGYADDGRTLLKSLSLLDFRISAETINWSDAICDVAATDRAILNLAIQQPKPAGHIAITNCIPTLCRPDPTARLNVLRTTFETDRLPPGWKSLLDEYDRVWVCSEFNARAFLRSGIDPQRLRVVGQAVDTDLFTPLGTRHSLPGGTVDRFIFFSVFDWQLRKGWDVLLKAYCQEFVPADRTALLIKLTRSHGHSLASVEDSVNRALRQIGQNWHERSDVILWDERLSQSEMAAVYRSVNAFVLSSRGEGWGRPYMEAMASQLPTIATIGSGNDDFMTERNSYLVQTRLVPVPEEAALEIPPYRGHLWLEPDCDSLRKKLREVFSDRSTAQAKAGQARTDIVERFSIPAQTAFISQAVDELLSSHSTKRQPDRPAGQLSVELEGEFFAGHSFSNINEALAQQWMGDKSLDLSLRRVFQQPVQPGGDRECVLKPLFDRPETDEASVVVRHAFPPNWMPPKKALWVHIQPWEFGYLPLDWVPPLRDLVAEAWVPSSFVRDIFVRSGVPAEKVLVMPWGVDTAVYSPSAPQMSLETEKSFRFLFVGGTIERKGFDTLLEAYLAEFKRNEDVCLVIKDLGTRSFYRLGNLQDRAMQAATDIHNPEILYFDYEMADDARASLYTSCSCLVAPYRGEGFGLPVLEAMACGVPAIVPRGGSTDDFTSEETAYYVLSKQVPCTHDWPLIGPAFQLSVEVNDLRKTMRQAFENRNDTERRGRAAAQVVASCYSWRTSAGRMVQRIHQLAGMQVTGSEGDKVSNESPMDIDIVVAVSSPEDLPALPACLGTVRPLVSGAFVIAACSMPRLPDLVAEYDAQLLPASTSTEEIVAQAAGRGSRWLLGLTPSVQFDNEYWRLIYGAVERNEEASFPAEAGASPAAILVRGNDLGRVQLSRWLQRYLAVNRAASGEFAEDKCFAQAMTHFNAGNFFHAEVYFSESLRRYSEDSARRRAILRALVTCHREMGDPYRSDEYSQLLVRTQAGAIS